MSQAAGSLIMSRLTVALVPARAALDRIAGEGERCAAESDQRNAARFELSPGQTDRFQREWQRLLRGWCSQLLDVGC